MIVEIAQLPIKPGTEADFEIAAGELRQDVLRLKGCQGLELIRSIEASDQYYLLIKWETADARSDFHNSEFGEKVALMAEKFFSGPPNISCGRSIPLV